MIKHFGLVSSICDKLFVVLTVILLLFKELFSVFGGDLTNGIPSLRAIFKETFILEAIFRANLYIIAMNLSFLIVGINFNPMSMIIPEHYLFQDIFVEVTLKNIPMLVDKSGPSSDLVVFINLCKINMAFLTSFSIP